MLEPLTRHAGFHEPPFVFQGLTESLTGGDFADE
jgi:hypothetical protein